MNSRSAEPLSKFDEYLKEVRARLEAATPGPWFEVEGE